MPSDPATSTSEDEQLTPAEVLLAMFILGEASRAKRDTFWNWNYHDHAILYASWALLGTSAARQYLTLACGALLRAGPVPEARSGG